MTKEKIERSEAILRKKRNTRKGLQVRNKILVYLYENRDEKISTQKVSEKVGFSYSSVTYHLKSMFAEEVVEKIVISRNVFWKITGLGQQTIKKWLQQNQN